MLGALLGSGWSLDSILDLSFEQMREVSSCIYAHKLQMIEIVAEPIAGAFGAKKKRQKITTTQKDLKNSQLSKEERDKILVGKLNALGFKDI